MTQIAAIDNNFVARMAGSGAFLPPVDAIATGAHIIERLVAVVKENGASAIKRGLFGALSIVTASATMWLIGVAMNSAFN
jgi:hypothetical protein